MDLFVGLDVSVRTTSVCVMDGTGKVLKEAKVESEPSAIATLLGNLDGHYRRVGLRLDHSLNGFTAALPLRAIPTLELLPDPWTDFRLI